MDKKAVEILISTFWSPDGWRHEASRLISEGDFAYAKSQGVMFDPVDIDHDGNIKLLGESISKLDRREVGDAFLASLSTRRLDWRSALGSYSVFQHMKSHPAVTNSHHCSVCGFYPASHTRDWNVLNFERFKWGGVRHAQVEYAAMDLQLLRRDLIPKPSRDDVRIFKELIASIENAPHEVTSANLHKHFPKSLKANKAERDVVIGILGYCGVLGTAEHPGFADTFVASSSRAMPDRRFVDMAYPACWWNGSDGVNQIRLQEYFGHAM